jgi:hypothetical protein
MQTHVSDDLPRFRVHFVWKNNQRDYVVRARSAAHAFHLGAQRLEHDYGVSELDLADDESCWARRLDH